MKSEWQTLIDDERGEFKLEFNSGMVFLHLILRQPMEGFRAARAWLPKVKEILRSVHYREVHVIIPDNDEKLYRFESMFGFRERRRARGHILMSQEC